MLHHFKSGLRTAVNRLRRLAGADPLDEDVSLRAAAKQAGQIVVIFALMLTVLIGLMGIALDTTYAWRESLRVQRASDAAALAGVVYMPNCFDTCTNNAKDTATAAAAQNGFAVQPTVTTVTPASRSGNPRELDVTISTQVPTFFARIFGINNWTVTRSSRAVYITPVPMGSPQPYYGVAPSYKIGSNTTTMTGPSSQAINPSNGFWATMLTPGAGAQSGDAFLAKRLNANQTTTTPANPTYDAADYYDYDIQMPANTTADVWIWDPVFCNTDGRQATGDFWLSNTNPVSSYFSLYDTLNQPYVVGAQQLVGSSGTFFANEQYADSTAGGTVSGSVTDCRAGQSGITQTDPRYWHDKWWDLSAYITANSAKNGTISGGTGGELFRLRTTTDPGDTSGDNTNAYNDFAVYVQTISGPGTPQVYGQGAMESYFLLPQSQTVDFYLAQIDQPSGAGKTIEIDLWDVGDVNNLSNATLQVLQPSGATWTPVTTGMSWTASKPTGSTSTAPCPNGSGSTITTYNGTKQYDGCWLTISITVNASYAPLTTNEWWKIRYTTGTGSDYATDLTTWQVNIRGNPVHLID